MKKITHIIAALLSVAAVASCDMFQLDNFDGPDAQVTGNLLDAKTGERIGIEGYSKTSGSWWSQTTTYYGALTITEQGWKNPKDGSDVSQDQVWLVRYDGHYTNNRIFAADYKVSMKNLPVYQPDNADFTIKKGRNTLDFKVTPFCRIINPQFSYDASARKIKATFSVELGDASKANNISNVVFCCNTTTFVGSEFGNMAKDDSGAKKQGNNVVAPGEQVTLEISLDNPKNVELFRYTQDRYLRVAAMAKGNGQNTNNVYNFSKIYKISADFKTITEVIWED